MLSLVPREAIRPLYRRARSEVDAPDPGDPLGLLTAFCEALLPLPPFDVWQRDRKMHPAAHLDEAERGPWPDRSAGPVAVAVRVVDFRSDLWHAELNVRSEEKLWSGHITFRTESLHETYSTGAIFLEQGADAVRDRFLEFDDRTLRAFLRSVLP